MKLSNLTRRLLDEANAGDGGQSAGGGVTGTDATQQQQQTQQATGNVLDQGKPAGGEQQHYIPEKFHVKKDDGSLDIEASARKLSDSYTNLERQRGNVEAPPATADQYTVNAPDQFKEVFQSDDPVLKGFLAKAHESGMSQKQVDAALGQFFEFIPQLQQGNAAVSAEEATTALRAVWKDEAEFKSNISGAFKAVSAYADPADVNELVQKYGNDPKFIKLLANVSREMKEDRPVNAGTGTTQSEDDAVTEMMNSEAYKNPRHADHAKVSQQIKSHFEKKFGKEATI